jgi:hypothetical protein
LNRERKVNGGWAHLSTLPFESLLAGLVVVSGIAGLLHYGVIDPIGALLPEWLVVGTQGAYLTSGLLMLLGMGRGRRDIEALGLVLLSTSGVIRWITYGYLLGFSPNFIVSGVFNTLIVVASVVRIKTILRGSVVHRLEPGESLVWQDGKWARVSETQ